MKSLVRYIYRLLPERIKIVIRYLSTLRAYVPLTSAYRNTRWLKDVYLEFCNSQRRYVFLSVARFLNINRPIDGYYFEFGCNGANTTRMAWDAFHHLFDMTYVGFDSFEGLPEIQEIDKQEIWAKGKLAYAESEYIRVVTAHGVPNNRFLTVRGFYDQSLTQDLKARLHPKKAAVIYIDCDLYASTVPVLNWVTDFLQRGTIIVFDDWNCFHADPEKGERRAWREYLEANSHLRFEPFVSTNEAQSFVFLGAR